MQVYKVIRNEGLHHPVSDFLSRTRQKALNANFTQIRRANIKAHIYFSHSCLVLFNRSIANSICYFGVTGCERMKHTPLNLCTYCKHARTGLKASQRLTPQDQEKTIIPNTLYLLTQQVYAKLSKFFVRQQSL